MEIIDSYYANWISRTRFESRAYSLELTTTANKKTVFQLKEQTSGSFGSFGTVWDGNCFEKNGILVFAVEFKTDWKYTFDMETKEEHRMTCSENWKVILSESKSKLEIQQEKEPGIVLHRIPPPLVKKQAESLIFWVYQAIFKEHKLITSNNKNVKSSFWSIDNLHISTFDHSNAEAVVKYCLITDDIAKTSEKVNKKSYQAIVRINERNRILKFQII